MFICAHAAIFFSAATAISLLLKTFLRPVPCSGETSTYDMPLPGDNDFNFTYLYW